MSILTITGKTSIKFRNNWLNRLIGRSLDKTVTTNVDERFQIDVPVANAWTHQIGPATLAVQRAGDSGITILIYASGFPAPLVSRTFSTSAPANWKVKASGHGVDLDVTISVRF